MKSGKILRNHMPATNIAHILKYTLLSLYSTQRDGIMYNILFIVPVLYSKQVATTVLVRVCMK